MRQRGRRRAASEECAERFTLVDSERRDVVEVLLGDPLRQYLIDTAEGFGVPEDDPLLLAVIAQAHPELTGPKVLDRLSQMTLRDFADPGSLMHLRISRERCRARSAGA